MIARLDSVIGALLALIAADADNGNLRLLVQDRLGDGYRVRQADVEEAVSHVLHAVRGHAGPAVSTARPTPFGWDEIDTSTDDDLILTDDDVSSFYL